MKYQSKMGTFLKQRLRSEIKAHHTSKSVKLKCILPKKRKKGFEGVPTVSGGVPCSFHAAVSALH